MTIERTGVALQEIRMTSVLTADRVRAGTPPLIESCNP